MPDEDNQIIVLLDEDDKEHEFMLMDSLEVKGTDYVVLLPLEEADPQAEVQEAIVMRVDTNDDGQEILCEIEDDDEWESVAEAWENALGED